MKINKIDNNKGHIDIRELGDVLRNNLTEHSGIRIKIIEDREKVMYQYFSGEKLSDIKTVVMEKLIVTEDILNELEINKEDLGVEINEEVEGFKINVVTYLIREFIKE